MRNLRIVRYNCRAVDSISQAEFQQKLSAIKSQVHVQNKRQTVTYLDATAFCINHSGDIYCSFSTGILQLSCEKFIAAWEESDFNKVVSLDYLSDEFVVCVLFSNGSVCLVNFETSEIKTYCLCFGTSEIEAASWAPNGHRLICFSQEELYFVSRHFQVEKRIKIESTMHGLEELMTVGWGSRETMFQGRSTRKKTPVVNFFSTNPSTIGSRFILRFSLSIQEAVIDPTELKAGEGRTLISWAADSHYFAVSFLDKTSTRRYSVWNGDGDLISRFENTAFMEASLAYKFVPLFNMIVSKEIVGSLKLGFLAFKYDLVKQYCRYQ